MIVSAERSSLYRMIWRWHFYAGLCVMPFVMILSITGGIYLFKPQIDRWEERSFQSLPTSNSASPNMQLAAASKAYPGTSFVSYRLPERIGDAAMIRVAQDDSEIEQDVFVSPQGKVLGSLVSENRISDTVARIHSSLLAGKFGAWLVELAGSWAIVMFLSGLYLWWPSGRRFAGVLWPRLAQGKRAFWRDLHAVTGFWVAGLALVLLVTALPWAGVWGETFQTVRAQLAWTKESPDWKIGAEGGVHQGHDHAAMMHQQGAGMPIVTLGDIVAKAKTEKGLVFPVIVKPPGSQMIWEVKSEAQNRPLRSSITYDMVTGKELSRNGFAEKHVIDKAVAYGIAWHEGQLFGWVNQLIGLLTAIALMTLMISGFVMWRRQKPAGAIGAPPLPAVPARIKGVVAIALLLALLLPILAISLVILWAFDRLILPYIPSLSVWLGVSKPHAA
jgi:uncharacterized iron-regulated membrane protein